MLKNFSNQRFRNLSFFCQKSPSKVFIISQMVKGTCKQIFFKPLNSHYLIIKCIHINWPFIESFQCYNYLLKLFTEISKKFVITWFTCPLLGFELVWMCTEWFYIYPIWHCFGLRTMLIMSNIIQRDPWFLHINMTKSFPTTIVISSYMSIFLFKYGICLRLSLRECPMPCFNK